MIPAWPKRIDGGQARRMSLDTNKTGFVTSTKFDRFLATPSFSSIPMAEADTL
jgi:hypothetical protein